MIELAEWIRRLRQELDQAMTEGAGERLRFELGAVEVEATVTTDREASAGGRVRFWVTEAEGGGRLTRSRTQRITFTLQPRTVAPDGTLGAALISGDEVGGER